MKLEGVSFTEKEALLNIMGNSAKTIIKTRC